MDSQRIAAMHYAILIGIDAYPDRPLKACVQDVRSIKEALQGQSVPIDIYTFTATKSADSEFFHIIEDPKSWPTYQNVISAFENITALARPGDFVYIHYCGHGTRSEPSSDLSNISTGDLALVLLNGSKGNEIRYLWGPRMAFSLKAMVEKSLVVTLVLDCCFSASVYRRGGTNTRFLPYNTKIGSEFPLDPETSLGETSRGSGDRNTSMLSNWLINPDRYAILTSCGPHEEASELIAQDGQLHGALSYFLLPLITSGGFRRKHKDIYRRLCANFKEFWPHQTPVLYGNKEQCFFGHDDSESNAVPITIYRSDGSLRLQAGQAHGFCDGDQFAIYSLGSTEKDILDSKTNTTVAQISHVRGLSSALNLSDTGAVDAQTSLVAKPLVQSFLRGYPIRLSSDLSHIDEWLTALDDRSLAAHLDNDMKAYSLNLILDSNAEYRILDGCGGEIINLPTLSLHHMSMGYICDVLVHLVKYRLVRDLGNKVQEYSFLGTFEARIVNRQGKVFHPGSLVEVEEDHKARFTFELQVENKGQIPLYIFMYNLSPLWQVEDIYHGSYEVIPPRKYDQGFPGVSRKRMKTTVPVSMRENGHRVCEDIVKVFVTSQPTSFDLLELPKLGHSIKRNAKSRESRGEGHASENWAALNFYIRTIVTEK